MTRGADRPDRRRTVGRRLTDRQAVILDMVSSGLGNKAIAHQLGISEQAVKEHVSVLLRRLDVRNRAGLADRAATRRLVGEDVDPAWLALLFQHAPMYVALLSTDLRFIAANEAVQRVLGEDIVGKTLAQAIPHIAATGILDELGAALTTGRARSVHELPIRWDRGGRLEAGYATVLIEPMRSSPEGEPAGLALFGVDVTDTVRARNEVRDLTAQQIALLEQMPSGVITVDRRGVVTNVNVAARAILRMSGPARDGLDAWEVLELHDPQSGEPIPLEERPLHRALRGDTAPARLYTGVLPGGHRVPLRMRAAPLFDARGEVHGAIAMFADTTEER